MKFVAATLLTLSVAIGVILATQPAQAEIRTKVVDYRLGETTLEGYLAYDDAVQGKRPGLLVAHDWTGVGDFVRKRTEALAKLGYVAFAPDIYGKGVRPPRPPAAAQEMAKYMKDRPLLRARMEAGLGILKSESLVDSNNIAAIGYCFGGAAVLELARAGADLAGVVSFHGDLTNPTPENARNIKARVLVLHGEDDPIVPQRDVEAFTAEMRSASADWQFVSYGGALHSFTNPAAIAPSHGAAYNEKAERSWIAMQAFFGELFDHRK